MVDAFFLSIRLLYPLEFLSWVVSGNLPLVTQSLVQFYIVSGVNPQEHPHGPAGRE